MRDHAPQTEPVFRSIRNPRRPVMRVIPTRAASEHQTVFSGNLKTLVGRNRSITGVARELGINRTQFNRFLYGESHPRPDVLAKICQHFRVDANILLIPLHELGWRAEMYAG